MTRHSSDWGVANLTVGYYTGADRALVALSGQSMWVDEPRDCDPYFRNVAFRNSS
jgi:hypothetical protein